LKGKGEGGGKVYNYFISSGHLEEAGNLSVRRGEREEGKFKRKRKGV